MTTYTEDEALDVLQELLLPKVMNYLKGTNIEPDLAWEVMRGTLNPSQFIVNPFVGDKKNIVNGYCPEKVAKIVAQNLKEKDY
jgi:hypothetical protein